MEQIDIKVQEPIYLGYWSRMLASRMTNWKKFNTRSFKGINKIWVDVRLSKI